MSTIANLSAAIESAAIESAAIESAAIESAAIESAAIESAAIESAAIESTAIESAAIESAAIESAATLARANLTPERVTLESLIVDCPELRKLTVGQLQQHTSKEVASRFLLRAFVSRALSGSAVDWQDKSLKGAMLPTASKVRAASLEPKANEWKGLDRSSIIDRVNEMLISVHSAIAPAAATKAAATELEKARKYISGLSPETLAALRKEGVI